MAEDKWAQKGITFKVPTLDDLDQIKDFLRLYFFPDEPIFRSLKLMGGNGGVVDTWFTNLQTVNGEI